MWTLLICMRDSVESPRQLLERELGDQLHLERAREILPTLLAPGETLLAAEQASLKLGRVGILAVTNRQLIHVYYGYFLRRLRTTKIGYDNVDSVHVDRWRSGSIIVVRLKERQSTVFLPSRTVNFPLIIKDAGVRAEALATCIRRAVRRVQEPLGPPLREPRRHPI